MAARGTKVMKASHVAFLLCRFLAIYCLLCAIGSSQGYFQFLATMFNMEFVFGTITTLKTGRNSPGLSWARIVIAAVPVALYILGWVILWWRAQEISEKITERFSDDALTFALPSKVPISFFVGLIGLYVAISCAPQLVYFLLAFFESYQTNHRGRIFSSAGQIIASLLQTVSGTILVWKANSIAQRLSRN
jgi:hypothetical protein